MKTGLDFTNEFSHQFYFTLTQWAKSPKKQSEGIRFCYFGTENTVPCCQNTPTDCFFGDFAHWVILLYFPKRTPVLFNQI